MCDGYRKPLGDEEALERVFWKVTSFRIKLSSTLGDGERNMLVSPYSRGECRRRRERYRARTTTGRE